MYIYILLLAELLENQTKWDFSNGEKWDII